MWNLCWFFLVLNSSSLFFGRLSVAWSSETLAHRLGVPIFLTLKNNKKYIFFHWFFLLFIWVFFPWMHLIEFYDVWAFMCFFSLVYFKWWFCLLSIAFWAIGLAGCQWKTNFFIWCIHYSWVGLISWLNLPISSPCSFHLMFNISTWLCGLIPFVCFLFYKTSNHDKFYLIIKFLINL